MGRSGKSLQAEDLQVQWRREYVRIRRRHSAIGPKPRAGRVATSHAGSGRGRRGDGWRWNSDGSADLGHRRPAREKHPRVACEPLSAVFELGGEREFRHVLGSDLVDDDRDVGRPRLFSGPPCRSRSPDAVTAVPPKATRATSSTSFDRRQVRPSIMELASLSTHGRRQLVARTGARRRAVGLECRAAAPRRTAACRAATCPRSWDPRKSRRESRGRLAPCGGTWGAMH